MTHMKENRSTVLFGKDDLIIAFFESKSLLNK